MSKVHPKQLRRTTQDLGKAVSHLSVPGKSDQGKTATRLKRVMRLLDKVAKGDETAEETLQKKGLQTIEDAQEKVAYKVEELQRFEDESPTYAETPGTDRDLEELNRANQKLVQSASKISEMTKEEIKK